MLQPSRNNGGKRRSSPGDEHGGVVVSDPVVWDGVSVAAAVLDAFLPFAEAVQGLPGVVVDLQRWLQDTTHPSQFEHTEKELSGVLECAERRRRGASALPATAGQNS